MHEKWPEIKISQASIVLNVWVAINTVRENAAASHAIGAAILFRNIFRSQDPFRRVTSPHNRIASHDGSLTSMGRLSLWALTLKWNLLKLTALPSLNNLPEIQNAFLSRNQRKKRLSSIYAESLGKIPECIQLALSFRGVPTKWNRLGQIRRNTRKNL